MPDHTKPSPETRAADRAALDVDHDAGQEPTPDEARAAETNTVSQDVKESYQEATERGANQKGEGRIS